jgi:uncharacterized protein (DUF1697 family)
MPTYVGLLRGVNVGGHNKVSMTALRDLVESLGHTEITTYIQSGNVVFTSKKDVTPASLERAIERELGVDVTVVLRTRAELKRTVRVNPFADADLATVHVGFMASKPAAGAVRGLDADQFAPEEFAIKGSDLYLHLPNGMGRTKLPAYLDRRLKVPTTVRNWKTVLKLLELAGG